MLKKFFITMLGSMAAFWLSLFFLFFLGSIAIGTLIAKSSSSDKVSAQTILHIDLQGDIPEREQEMSLMDAINSADLGSETFVDILASIKAAAKDKDIHGIFIECQGSSLGMASREELLEALTEFKASGKWIYAYANTYEQGDYYLATVADKIFLNPVGMVNVHGLATTTIFFKNLLDKIGVEVQVVKVGSYKSAVEPFIRTDMSEPSREQTTVFLTQIWDTVAGSIAANRQVTKEAVNLWADSLSMTWAPERYLEHKIVSELKYRQEVDSLLRAKAKVDSKEPVPLVTPSEYMLKKNSATLSKGGKKHIAVYYAVGDIVDSGSGGIVGPTVVEDLLALAEDKNVAGLVLRVNSGGGSAFASEQIWHAVEKFKATGRPVYVSMGDYAASGGYYISCGADSIFADPSTLTGSIGIFGMIPNANKLLTDKIGLNFDNVETNPGANIPVGYKGMSPRQYDAMQKYVERGYETFTSRVAAGRDLPIDSVKAIGGGRVWDGITALKLGLVDHLGSLTYVIRALARDLDLKENQFVNYPDVNNEWMELLKMSKMVSVDTETSATLNDLRDLQAWKQYFMDMSPLQARMEILTIE